MAIPVPKQPVGYRRGLCSAPVQVEAFIDLECPFSKKAWTTLLELPENYSGDRLGITVYPTVLANHRQSWEMTKTAVILAEGESIRFWDFVTYLYGQQKKFNHDAFQQKTHADLQQLLAHHAHDFAGWADEQAFIEKLQSDEIENKAKAPIRFSITRGIWSTPTFLVNGVEVPQLSSSSALEDWQDVIDPLLA